MKACPFCNVKFERYSVELDNINEKYTKISDVNLNTIILPGIFVTLKCPDCNKVIHVDKIDQ